jgi:hypothetical protein
MMMKKPPRCDSAANGEKATVSKPVMHPSSTGSRSPSSPANRVQTLAPGPVGHRAKAFEAMSLSV